MIKQILISGNPKLREISKPVTKIDKKVKQLITDLKDTLAVQDDPEGVGLAAPQIGVNLRVFLIKPKNEVKVFINPEIISTSNKKTKADKKEKKIMEGCLSLPHFYGPLERKYSLRIKYQNEDGKEIVEEYRGIDAQIVQHEVDHLDGMLFVDRLLEQKKKLYEYKKNGEWEEVEL